MKRWFERKFSSAEVVGMLVAGFVGVTTLAYAVDALVEFHPGEVAKSADVNANFQYLDAKITAIGDGGGCPAEMVRVGTVCIDKYEASVWTGADGSGTQYGMDADNYPSTFPDTGNWKEKLYAVSKAGVTPSRFITWFQAQQACAASGKRLLTNAEWQMAAAGTPDGAPCIVDNGTSPAKTGTASCVSSWGVYDMVGNVYEWVADWMQGNTDPYQPSDMEAVNTAKYGEDRVSGVNPAEVTSASTSGEIFPTALLRGGYYAGKTSSGIFALIARNAPSSGQALTGFRCAR